MMGQAARRRLGLLRYPMLNEGVGQKASLYSLAALKEVRGALPLYMLRFSSTLPLPHPPQFFSTVGASSLESWFFCSFASCRGSSLSERTCQSLFHSSSPHRHGQGSDSWTGDGVRSGSGTLSGSEACKTKELVRRWDCERSDITCRVPGTSICRACPRKGRQGSRVFELLAGYTHLSLSSSRSLSSDVI